MLFDGVLPSVEEHIREYREDDGGVFAVKSYYLLFLKLTSPQLEMYALE